MRISVGLRGLTECAQQEQKSSPAPPGRGPGWLLNFPNLKSDRLLEDKQSYTRAAPATNEG
jgi:hypothetical protein